MGEKREALRLRHALTVVDAAVRLCSVDGNASPLFNANLLTFAVPSVATFAGPAVTSGGTGGGEVVIIGGRRWAP